MADLVCGKIDMPSDTATSIQIAECFQHLSTLLIAVQSMPEERATPFAHSGSDSGPFTSRYLGTVQNVVDHVRRSPYLIDALRLKDISDVTDNDLAIILVKRSSSTMIKNVHAAIVSECRRTSSVISSDDLNILQWYVRMFNLVQTMDSPRSPAANMVYPQVGSRFNRSDMISTVEVFSGVVGRVLVPAIPQLGLKALVDVE
jgi:hypothetical protein